MTCYHAAMLHKERYGFLFKNRLFRQYEPSLGNPKIQKSHKV